MFHIEMTVGEFYQYLWDGNVPAEGTFVGYVRVGPPGSSVPWLAFRNTDEELRYVNPASLRWMRPETYPDGMQA